MEVNNEKRDKRNRWWIVLAILLFLFGVVLPALLVTVKDRIDFMITTRQGRIGVLVKPAVVAASEEGWVEVTIQNRSATKAEVDVVPFQPKEGVSLWLDGQQVLHPWEQSTLRFRVLQSPVDRPQVLVRLMPVEDEKKTEKIQSTRANIKISVPITILLNNLGTGRE